MRTEATVKGETLGAKPHKTGDPAAERCHSLRWRKSGQGQQCKRKVCAQGGDDGDAPCEGRKKIDISWEIPCNKKTHRK